MDSRGAGASEGRMPFIMGGKSSRKVDWVIRGLKGWATDNWELNIFVVAPLFGGTAFGPQPGVSLIKGGAKEESPPQ